MSEAPGNRVTLAPSLGVGSPGWRAARAITTLDALLSGRLIPDDALMALDSLGTPPSGWWDVLAEIRRCTTPGRLSLVLPRPGDPRGVALPRDVAAEGALGWPTHRGSTWLVCAPTGWRLIADVEQPLPATEPQDAHQTLRAEIVRAAHILDGQDLPPPAERGSVDAIVDSWIMGPPPIPAHRRSLASSGLRILLGLDVIAARRGGAAVTSPGGVGVDQMALDRAARSAVEAAYSTHGSPG